MAGVAALVVGTAGVVGQGEPGRNPMLIEDLVAANRILADQGIVDGYGHVSVRSDRDPKRFFISRSLAPELVTAEDVMELDLDSNYIDARGRNSYQERFIHGEIYKARPDVMAVVHMHAPAVIPFGASDVQMRPMYHMSAFIGEGLPVWDIRETGGITDMLVTNATLGRSLAKTLGDRGAVLMRGHGAAISGPSLPIVVGRSIYLKINAEVQLQAKMLGGNVKYLDPAEAKKVGDTDSYQRAWQLWRRKALGR
jgi:HCOMODA/2-hydroxy-3-carboxy-muconic semialdehyde decarboxylase